ncbi:MAG: HD domain-containing protein [Chloroflexi bacterium]|nr:HD domain-containing protein [Chloroflexota bacterium]
MPNIEDAIKLALEKHHGQTDKGGAAYITHPLRIMAQMQTETEQIVAVLHDVVEDSDVTLDDLHQMGFSEEIVTALDHLSRRADETYEQFIQRIKPHPLAVRVKLGDLRDNMDIRRAGALDEKALERFERYRKAWLELTEG